jgi:hypothetical protein
LLACKLDFHPVNTNNANYSMTNIRMLTQHHILILKWNYCTSVAPTLLHSVNLKAKYEVDIRRYEST